MNNQREMESIRTPVHREKTFRQNKNEIQMSIRCQVYQKNQPKTAANQSTIIKIMKEKHATAPKKQINK